MSLPDLKPEYRALIDVETVLDSGELLYQQTLQLSQLADEIASETNSLRAIAQAAALKKDLVSLLSHHQAFLSKQALVKSGEWDEILAKLNLDLFAQTLQK